MANILSNAELIAAATAYAAHGARGAEQLGIPERTYRDRVAKARLAGLLTMQVQPAAPTLADIGKPVAAAKNIADFRAAHDNDFIVPNKIRDGIKRLGVDRWMYEQDFAKFCNIGHAQFSIYRDQFSEYIVLTSGGNNAKRVWTGSSDFANRLRAMVS